MSRGSRGQPPVRPSPSARTHAPPALPPAKARATPPGGLPPAKARATPPGGLPPAKARATPPGGLPLARAAVHRAREGGWDDGGDDGAITLLQKYQVLSRKYAALVQRLEAQTRDSITTTQLTRAALRASSLGFAIVRRGGVALTSPGWQALVGADARAAWRPYGAAPGVTRPLTLREVAVEVAARAAEQPRIERYVHASSGRVLELRVGQTSPEGADVAVVVATDVTARVRDEEEIARTRETFAQRERLLALGQLASGVAHDLNNTLGALVLRVDALIEDPGFTSEQRARFAPLANIVADGAAIVARLQDFAKQRADAPLEALDLAAEVASAVEMARTEIERRPSFPRAAVRVETDVPATLPPVRGVRSELRHLFVNLLLNARDAMHAGGTIRVTAARDGDAAVVARVEDEGTGIAPEHLARVFDPFFSTKGAHGHGLGLSTAFSAMERCGGTITAANRAPRGAVFTLRFQTESARDGAADATLRGPRAALAAGALARLAVLVVDDDVAHGDALRAALARECCRVDGAYSARDALDRVAAGTRYDVFLCDVGMRDMNGWELAETLRRAAPGARVVMITGWTREVAGDDPRRHVAHAVIAKPVDLTKLRALLARG